MSEPEEPTIAVTQSLKDAAVLIRLAHEGYLRSGSNPNFHADYKVLERFARACLMGGVDFDDEWLDDIDEAVE